MATRKRRRSARRNPASVLRRLIRRKRKNSWFDDAAGHSKAARVGWKTRKRRKPSRKGKTIGGMPANMAWGSAYPRKRKGRKGKRHNPFYARRRTRRHYRRNPLNVRGLIPNKAMLMTSLKLGIGVTAGFVSTSVVSKVMSMAKLGQYDKYLGVGQVVLGSLMVAMGRKKGIKDIGLMIAGFGVYDLIQQNLAMSYLPPIPRAIGLTNMIPGLSASYAVGHRPVSRVAGAVPMAASYQPQLSSSYDTTNSRTVGLGEDAPMGHLPGIDFEY